MKRSLHKKLKLKKNDEYLGFFITLLVKYPEVEVVEFDPHERTLKLQFAMLKEAISPEEAQKAKELEKASLAFLHLEHRKGTVCKSEISLEDGVAILSIVRDIDSISNVELQMLLALVEENFDLEVYLDQGEEELMDEPWMLEETETYLLDLLRRAKVSKTLFALRDKGKVMILTK